MKKTIFDLIFIVVFLSIVYLIKTYDRFDSSTVFILALSGYWIGQFIEKKFGKSQSTDTE